MVQVLPVAGCCVGPQLPLQVTNVARWLKEKRRLTLLEPFRMIIVLINF